MKSHERLQLAIEAYFAFYTIDSSNDKCTRETLARAHRAYINRWNAHVKESFDKFAKVKIADHNRKSVKRWIELRRY